MKDYKKLITEFYKKYNPEQLDRVDYLLKKYKGREEELLSSLEKKYIDSAGILKTEKTARVKKEVEKEKLSKKESASSPESTEKKTESKTEWEKRREEILRQVRERSESLKKKRESNEAKSRDVEKTEVIEQAPEGFDKTEILETASVSNETKEEPEAKTTKRTKSVARYSEEEIRPKLRIPNPGAMSAAQRAAFWAEQLEVKEQLRLRRMSEKALNIKYDEPEPEPPTVAEWWAGIVQDLGGSTQANLIVSGVAAGFTTFITIGAIAILSTLRRQTAWSRPDVYSHDGDLLSEDDPYAYTHGGDDDDEDPHRA